MKKQKFDKKIVDTSFKRKQSHSPDVNHTLHLLNKPKGCQEPCTKVQSQSPAEQISRI